MSEIKEREYIRTIKGNICKVLSIREKHRFMTASGHPSVTPERYFVDNSKQYTISKPYIKKHSFDIIDLIEVGDLVYVDISPDDCGGIIVPRIAETERELIDLKFLIKNKDYILKSIITHEQIENMEYRV
jgi:hypothetical protein